MAALVAQEVTGTCWKVWIPQWIESGSDQRLANYTSVPPGTYTFRVQGATSRGPWSEPGAIVRIEIFIRGGRCSGFSPQWPF